jgi:two-component system, cell cycle sensor histidine kinase and response regulator CckA
VSEGSDVLEANEREAELRRVTDELRQAQKMEAVGRLASGVAHDLNNMLAAIIGCAGLMRESIARDNPLFEDLEQIVSAANRAAQLTHKLLAFSRQQMRQPVLVDLGEVVASMEDVLRRMLGPKIELVTDRDPTLAPVLADRAQLEQLILSLAVSARDALLGGGRISIEAKSGERAVELVVIDNGRARDTNPSAMAIVAQSQGELTADREPGLGWVVRVRLPPQEGFASRIADGKIDRSLHGKETVLLVEDEPLVRSSTTRVLGGLGYKVLSAANAIEAIEASRLHSGPIQLLLTDLILPGMGGRELADKLREARPDLRVLMMSGSGSDDADSAFIAKPFSPETIARKIRALLDAE